MNFLKSIASVGGFTILSRITGFMRETLQAHYIGVNVVSDAIGIAIKVPSLLRRIFAEGAFNASFVPMFSGILAAQGKQEAFKFASNVFMFLILALFSIVLSVELFLPDLIPFLFRGLIQTPERLALTIEFSKITFPFLLFISLTAFFSGILNSFEKFTAAASSPAAGNLCIILCIIFLTPTVQSAGHALIWGILGCGVVQLLWVLIPCLVSGISVSFVRPRVSDSLKRFFKVMVPAALGSGVVQINFFFDVMIASYLKVGGISYMNYADRLAQLPLSVIGVAMSTVLLPVLSKQWRKGNAVQALETQALALRLSFVLVAPAMLVLIFLAPFLVEHLYQHGAFQAQDVLPTAYTLIALASGLPAYIMVKIFSTVFFANGDTKTPMKIGILGVLLNIALNVLLIRQLECVGVALATSIAAWVQAMGLSLFLKKKKLLDFSCFSSDFLWRFLSSIVSLIAYLLYVNPLVCKLATEISRSSFFVLPLAILGLTLFYFSTAHILKIGYSYFTQELKRIKA